MVPEQGLICLPWFILLQMQCLPFYSILKAVGNPTVNIWILDIEEQAPFISTNPATN
jgi:hypothetical protein